MACDSLINMHIQHACCQGNPSHLTPELPIFKSAVALHEGKRALLPVIIHLPVGSILGSELGSLEDSQKVFEYTALTSHE